ncbi:MAG: hypothetical protein AAFR91_02145 [Pseudomonadota bacterium]
MATEDLSSGLTFLGEAEQLKDTLRSAHTSSGRTEITANPPDFDYAFNLEHGRKQTDKVAVAKQLRESIDEDTRSRLKSRSGSN